MTVYRMADPDTFDISQYPESFLLIREWLNEHNIILAYWSLTGHQIEFWHNNVMYVLEITENKVEVWESLVFRSGRRQSFNLGDPNFFQELNKFIELGSLPSATD